KPYQDRNSKELYAFNIRQAKTLWIQLIEPGLRFDQLFTEGEFREALSNFEQQLRQICIESPEAIEALKYYKENYYKSAIDTLTNLNVFNDKLADEMKERQKLHEQYLDLAKKEMELNNKLEERDQQMQTIRETLDAKSAEIQRAIEQQHVAEVNMERLKAENQRVINDVRIKHAEDMARLQSQLHAARNSGGGSPIQLVRYEKKDSDEFGKIHVVPEALEILQRIKEPVAVIASARTEEESHVEWLGFSLSATNRLSILQLFRFANALHGRHDGFELGAQANGCTRGIYMWDIPFDYEDKRVIVLDTEGIDDPKQEAEWATKLFILCLVLSSSFIYNINGVVGSGDIGKLRLMRDLSRYIQPPEYLPHLKVVLKLTVLSPTSTAAEGIKKLFKEFSVFALPHPGIGGKRLQQMQAVSTTDLDDEFVEETAESVRQIYKKLEPKYIGHLKMNGLSFAMFLTDCVEKMNDPENNAHLSIPNEYEIIQYVAQNMRDKCLGIYRNFLEMIAESIPMSWINFNAMDQTFSKRIMKKYVGGLVGTLKQIDEFKEKFQRDMTEAKKPYQDRNSKELIYSRAGRRKHYGI
ncbi:9363_t:CDS:2, partial [Paraglomus brasilianum]